MPLPSAAKKQIRKAEKLHKEVYGGDAPEPKTELAPVSHEEATANVIPDPAPEAKPEPAPAPEPPPAATQEPAPKPEDWEQKYRSLQGMFESKIKPLQEETTQLRGELANTQALLATIQAKPEPAPEPQKPLSPRLKEADVEAYGSEMVDVIKRAAYDELVPEINTLREKNAELERLINGVTTRSAKTDVERMETAIAEAVPTWEVINKDPGFLQWLREPDEFSGKPRQSLLDDAAASFDASRVIRFFTTYQATASSPTALGNEPKAETPGAEHQPNVDINTLVAPGRSRKVASADPMASGETQFFTQADIAKFYRDVQRGAYRNDPKEKMRRERMIHKAVAEGRIR